jgi:hypothetical protein
MSKNYVNPDNLNETGDILVVGGPILVAKTKAADIPTPGSGISLSEDYTTSGQLNIKSAAGSVSLGTTGIITDASAASFTITQAVGLGAGATTTIAAQSAGGKDKSGGALILSSGAKSGSGADGAVGIALGGNVYDLFDATTITIVQATVQFSQSAATPAIKQYDAGKDTAGQAMSVFAQAGGAKDKTADGAGGNLTIGSGAGGGTAVPGTFTIKVGGASGTTVFAANKTGIAFNGATVAAVPAITGAKADAVAASILTALVGLGLVTDSTT